MRIHAGVVAPAIAVLLLVPSRPRAEGEQPPGPVFVQPGDNLVSDGIPPIPAEIAESVGRYTEFRSADFLGWHPTRREMLIATRFGDTAQVHEVRFPGGARRQLTFFPDRIRGASWPRRSGEYFVFVKDRGGDEFGQIYRLDVVTGATTMISDGGRSQNGLGPWSHQGDRMAFASTRRNGVDRDIYVMDPRDPGSVQLVLEVKGGGWRPQAFSPDDRKLVVGEVVSVNESYLWILDLATGGKTLATPKGPEKVAYGDAHWSADGKGLYLTTDRDSEFQRLAYLDLASGRHSYLSTRIPWDVERFALSPDGKTIAFDTNEEGLSVLRLLDVVSGKERARPSLPPGVIGGLEWHESGRELALVLTSAHSPSDVYSVDATALGVERWTESETGGLNAAGFAEPELVRWKSFDGKTISGFLYEPPARFAFPRPVMINIHGGPEGQARPGFLGRQNFFLQELGVALLVPNVRGSTGFGKSFVKLDNGVLREESVKDIGAALDWIATRHDLDASRVMITGGSYGGYMTLASATHFDARIRCAVDVVGISSFVSFLEHTEGYRRDLRRVEYGDERDPAMREHLLRISPLQNARKITKPLFVVQGKNDPRVPYTESEQMVATVKKNGGAVWYLLANDEGHGFAKKTNQDFQFYATVAFVRRYLIE
jgi:dipeptidyl aminopeptidase/acylaminoacyl peptidase